MYSLFEQAQIYVGNTDENFYKAGELQLELLKMNGCTPTSQVLEIGCGCLVAGKPILEFLQPNHYVGIEPNEWLINAVKEGLEGVAQLIEQKQPVFLATTDFDASICNRKFDFIIGHSVLSHAAAYQIPQFMKAVKKVLAPKGVVLTSIRFHDNDNHIARDSNHTEWVYPGVSFYAWETVRDIALQEGLFPEWRPDYRELFISQLPSNHHDWMRLTNFEFQQNLYVKHASIVKDNFGSKFLQSWKSRVTKKGYINNRV